MKGFVLPAISAGLPLTAAVIAGLAIDSSAVGLAGVVERFSSSLSSELEEAGLGLGLGIAFAAGMVSTVNPCGFPMLPAYLAMYLGSSEDPSPAKHPRYNESFGRLYLSFEGRISRSTFWFQFVLPVIAIGVILVLVDAAAVGGRRALPLIWSLILIWPGLAILAKRWHDRDKPAWWILIGLIPIVGGLWTVVELGLLRGSHGENRFGPESSYLRPSDLRRLAKALMVGGVVTSGFVLLFGTAGLVIGAGAGAVLDAIPWVGLSIGVLLALTGGWLLGGGKLYSGLATRAAAHIGDTSQVSIPGYFLFGLGYATASLSCTLPIFLAVTGISLTSGSLLSTIGQFFVYGLGMGFVITLLTLAIALFKGAMVGALRQIIPHVQTISAGFMILAGAYIVFYWLTIGGVLD